MKPLEGLPARDEAFQGGLVHPLIVELLELGKEPFGYGLVNLERAMRYRVPLPCTYVHRSGTMRGTPVRIEG